MNTYVYIIFKYLSYGFGRTFSPPKSFVTFSQPQTFGQGLGYL